LRFDFVTYILILYPHLENIIHVQADKGKAIEVIKPDSYNELAARHP